MILGVGVDIAQIDRFEQWSNYSRKQLAKIYLEAEMDFCFDKEKSIFVVQKLASRFAAKEAFFKAFSAMLIKLDKTENDIPFLFVCKQVEIVRGHWNVPYMKVNWGEIESKVGYSLPNVQVNLSISHEKQYTVVYVILSS